VETIVYIDGFNLYYGVLKDTPYRWLDPAKLCQHLLPPNRICRIKYFTAKVQARPNDPHGPTHQEMYFRALRTVSDLEIILGHFLANPVRLPLRDGSGFAEVIRTEEKGSDVNIATHLVFDAFKQRFETAVLITNDSDLQEPVRIVTQELGLKVGVISPLRGTRRTSRALAQHATFVKRIRRGVLKASQFPDRLSDAVGRFRKPSGW
jgi:uncharacterized LabA/DUF88 family protein